MCPPLALLVVMVTSSSLPWLVHRPAPPPEVQLQDTRPAPRVAVSPCPCPLKDITSPWIQGHPSTTLSLSAKTLVAKQGHGHSYWEPGAQGDSGETQLSPQFSAGEVTDWSSLIRRFSLFLGRLCPHP